MIDNIYDGVYPTMVTPFTKDNNIDFPAVERLVNWYASKGVSGIFAVCQSSEMFFLSIEERVALVRFIRRHLPKGLVLIASGHVADTMEEQVSDAEKMIAEGIDAYVFLSNRFARADETDSVMLERMFETVERLGGNSFGIYECPYPYKRVMQPDALKTLALTGKFKFLKDTCCDAELIGKKLSAVKGTGLKIFNANAATLLETLKAGCSGYSGVMANFHPDVYAWLCANYEKEPLKAQKVQDFAGFFSVAECQMYPVNAKYYLNLEGLDITTRCRCCDEAAFTKNRKLEIEQMHGLNRFIKEAMGIA